MMNELHTLVTQFDDEIGFSAVREEDRRRLLEIRLVDFQREGVNASEPRRIVELLSGGGAYTGAQVLRRGPVFELSPEELSAFGQHVQKRLDSSRRAFPDLKARIESVSNSVE